MNIDTLRLAKQLGAHFPPEQSEALTEALAGLVESDLATKRDLKELEMALRHDVKELEVTLKRDIKELELRLEAKIAETKAELVRWVIGAGFLQTALIAALLLKLVK